MTKKKKKRSSAASNGSRTSKASAQKTTRKNAPVRAAASGSGGAKSKATAKQQPKKATAAPSGKATPGKQPATKVNAWRDEPGTDQPLRIGRGIRTRDEYFKGQKGKSIHLEQHPDELYRRTVVLEIDDDENLLLVQIKRPTARHGEPVPLDKKNRRYIQDALTLDDNDEPIRLKKGKFELAPYSEDVREDQAKKMSEDTEKKTHENKRRFLRFRKKK